MPTIYSDAVRVSSASVSVGSWDVQGVEVLWFGGSVGRGVLVGTGWLVAGRARECWQARRTVSGARSLRGPMAQDRRTDC